MTERHIRTYADDLHALDGIGAAGDDRLFLIVIFDRDLTVETFAVPAKVGFRDRFHVEKLKAPEDRIVFRHLVPFADIYDLDQALEWNKYFRVRLHFAK